MLLDEPHLPQNRTRGINLLSEKIYLEVLEELPWELSLIIKHICTFAFILFLIGIIFFPSLKVSVLKLLMWLQTYTIAELNILYFWFFKIGFTVFPSIFMVYLWNTVTTEEDLIVVFFFHSYQGKTKSRSIAIYNILFIWDINENSWFS